MSSFPPVPVWQDIVALALREDLGRRGDITSRALFTANDQCRAGYVARKSGVLCGIEIVRHIIQTFSPDVQFVAALKDGDHVYADQTIATVTGPTIAILEAERTTLNFLSHLSGVATLTRSYVDLLEDTGTMVCCTRKTTPGLRALEKYAVSCGGGANHRFGLDDGVMIKDNHIAAAGDLGKAITRARTAVGHMIKIEVEVETIAQLEAALAYKADVIMLDNWPLDDLPAAVKMIDGRAIVEASGGITLDTIAAVAAAGVDVISVGALTHSAPILDIGLDIA